MNSTTDLCNRHVKSRTGKSPHNSPFSTSSYTLEWVMAKCNQRYGSVFARCREGGVWSFDLLKQINLADQYGLPAQEHAIPAHTKRHDAAALTGLVRS